MRVAYLDCFSGISGDMLLGALIACGVDAGQLRGALGSLNLPGWRLKADRVSRNGIGAIDVTVGLMQEPAHGRHLADIEQIIDESGLSESVRSRARAVFQRLAEAESKVHQTTPQRIHFHEVGAVDAIVDIVGACVGFEMLGVESIVCSPLPMGRGFVECAHGVIPLPAPAVMELTGGLPVYGVDVEGELVTPTGAAIAATLSDRLGVMPTMTLGSVGYGAGKKRFGDRPNLLRVVVGETVEDSFSGAREVAVLETNLDDLSPQFYEVVSEKLFEQGALDVFLSPIQMKKGRPAVLLTVLAPTERAETLAGVMFRETTTLGVRFGTMKRLCVEREWKSVETEYGAIRVKVGRWQGRETTSSPEYEDVRSAALAHDAPIKDVHRAAVIAYERDK